MSGSWIVPVVVDDEAHSARAAAGEPAHAGVLRERQLGMTVHRDDERVPWTDVVGVALVLAHCGLEERGLEHLRFPIHDG